MSRKIDFGKEASVSILLLLIGKFLSKLYIYTEKKVLEYSKGWNLVRVPVTNHYVDQTKHFISCTQEDKNSQVSGEEGRADLAVVRQLMIQSKKVE